MTKSEIMKAAHGYARAHRAEYASYRDALSVGMKEMHRRSKAENDHRERAVPETSPETSTNIWEHRVEEVREARRNHYMLMDWKNSSMPWRKDYRRWFDPNASLHG